MLWGQETLNGNYGRSSNTVINAVGIMLSTFMVFLGAQNNELNSEQCAVLTPQLPKDEYPLHYGLSLAIRLVILNCMVSFYQFGMIITWITGMEKFCIDWNE